MEYCFHGSKILVVLVEITLLWSIVFETYNVRPSTYWSWTHTGVTCIGSGFGRTILAVDVGQVVYLVYVHGSGLLFGVNL